jgi:hypothetical protein
MKVTGLHCSGLVAIPGFWLAGRSKRVESGAKLHSKRQKVGQL